ncbi:hypothetical protein J1605_014694 [Eschrichtius robustus]|uniref:Uncharacterized protein n=1 Tax=Eschrichtius robustus TaxID=9764 RepID=A0AB34GBS5_ESCRO|nr:hypothetical protein J1605_014694 [Eschrichtius robustus]
MRDLRGGTGFENPPPRVESGTYSQAPPYSLRLRPVPSAALGAAAALPPGGPGDQPERGHRFEPWSGKIPHAAEQLSPCITTTEPAL